MQGAEDQVEQEQDWQRDSQLHLELALSRTNGSRISASTPKGHDLHGVLTRAVRVCVRVAVSLSRMLQRGNQSRHHARKQAQGRCWDLSSVSRALSIRTQPPASLGNTSSRVTPCAAKAAPSARDPRSDALPRGKGDAAPPACTRESLGSTVAFPPPTLSGWSMSASPPPPPAAADPPDMWAPLAGSDARRSGKTARTRYTWTVVRGGGLVAHRPRATPHEMVIKVEAQPPRATHCAARA
jgi:hypothetical protein